MSMIELHLMDLFIPMMLSRVLLPDHPLLDMSPNIGPLISRSELGQIQKLLKQKL
jgi:hypothetical protein